MFLFLVSRFQLKCFFMFRVLMRVIIIFFCISLLAISCAKGPGSASSFESSQNAFELPLEKEFVNVPKSRISVAEYLEWVKAQKGITYSELETNQLKISLLYRPLQLESALGTNPNSKNWDADFKTNLENKKEYHYLLLECLDKLPHAENGNSAQKKLLENVKTNLYVVLNQKDTVENPIVEEFLSYILNQPSQLLVLIPKNSLTTSMEVGVKGESIDVGILKINLSKKQLESFPEIKL